ncbi:Exonuclease [Popillia japonica]|uniref:Exonuclease n=1 Tax=Popillia japonica TaxID=7064 RepID=A0AAW1MEK2_POPJA
MDTESVFLNSSILIAVVFGGALLVLMYILKAFRLEKPQTAGELKNVKEFDEQFNARRETPTASSTSAHKKKKNADNRWTNRTDKQGFAHPWLLTTLKGHTGQVLDMDFASNGKYLASCADEEPDPGEDLTNLVDTGGSSSGSECNKENSRPSSADQSPRATKPLSRRQRKNRRREDSSSPETKKKSKAKKASSPSTIIPIVSAGNSPEKKNNLETTPCKKSSDFSSTTNYDKLGISDSDLYRLLRSAIIFKSAIEVPSYPRSAYKYNKPESKSNFDVNAREFIPNIYKKVDGIANSDSGNSSDSGENDSEDSCSSSSSPVEKPTIRTYQQALMNGPQQHQVQHHRVFASYEHTRCETTIESICQKTCVRCGIDFYMNHDNTYITQESCSYHWGKLTRVLGENRTTYGISNEYMCCRGKQNSRGCTQGKLHVWNGLVTGFNGPFEMTGFNGPFESYAKTKVRKVKNEENTPGVYALDCEMCFTGHGLELVKISVVAADGRLVYDVYVKPENEIVDYNSRFSGITAKDMQKRRTLKTLKEVQNDLMGFIDADTILIGHGLENDLRALRILHPTVIDTAVAFPHYNGLPYRRSLKSLISCFLKREIQTGSSGHNSYEDAKACMDLMLWRVRKDFRSIIDHHHSYF